MKRTKWLTKVSIWAEASMHLQRRDVGDCIKFMENEE